MFKPLPLPPDQRPPATGNVVVYIASDLLGKGDEQLGRILMCAFLKTLKDVAPLPNTMIFINSGVRLTTAGSDVIDDLSSLANLGVMIISCGTCLDYYRLKDALQVGTVTNMYEIAATLLRGSCPASLNIKMRNQRSRLYGFPTYG